MMRGQLTHILDNLSLLVIYFLVWQRYNYRATNANAVDMNGCRASRKKAKSNQTPACAQSARVRIGTLPKSSHIRKCNSVPVLCQ